MLFIDNKDSVFCILFCLYVDRKSRPKRLQVAVWPAVILDGVLHLYTNTNTICFYALVLQIAAHGPLQNKEQMKESKHSNIVTCRLRRGFIASLSLSRCL